MSYQVGDRIVYPHHGAAVISGTTTKTIDQVEYEMYVVKPVSEQFIIYIKKDGAEKLGIRAPISEEDAEEMLSSYFVSKPQKDIVWSRRYKNNVENLKSGDPYQVAEVIRDLAFSNRNLSSAEKRQFLEGMGRLCSELSLVLGVEYEVMVKRLYSCFPKKFVDFILPFADE